MPRKCDLCHRELGSISTVGDGGEVFCGDVCYVNYGATATKPQRLERVNKSRRKRGYMELTADV